MELDNLELENEIDEEINEDSIDNTNSDTDNIELDNTDSESEDVIEIDKDFIMESILHELEVRALEESESALTTESGNTGSSETSSGSTTGEYYDLLIQMNSHLEYIEEHLYETPSGHDINTPLNQYGLSEILLVGVLIVLGLSFVFNVIKDNVIHIR